MRFLIVATVFVACACAAPAPSGLLATSYSALAPALPTISAGDINGAAIDAHVEAADHLRTAVDATRQLHDKVSEGNGLAINNAEEYAWRSVDAVKTAEAQLDGAAAGASPIVAKSLVRGPLAAPVAAYAAAPLAAYAATPLAYSANTLLAQSLSPLHPGAVTYAASPLSYASAW